MSSLGAEGVGEGPTFAIGQEIAGEIRRDQRAAVRHPATPTNVLKPQKGRRTTRGGRMSTWRARRCNLRLFSAPGWLTIVDYCSRPTSGRLPLECRHLPVAEGKIAS
jgi:hypothetical protein